MKSIRIIEGHKAEIQEVPLPKLRDDYVLAKVNCVALNPTDWKHIDSVGDPGCLVGCDFSGTIEDIGPAVKKSWKKGDRFAAFVHGGNRSNHEDGCFAEFCVAKGDLGIKIPDSMSDEEASTLGVGVTTVGQGLYQSLGLPLPGSGDFGKYLLVYGGSSATGTLAIQYAKLSGCKVITTCSAHNFDLVKKLGAEAAFDYTDPDCAKKIREYTQDQLMHVFDTISEGNASQICEESISSQGGVVSHLLPAKHTREDVANKHMLGYTANGEEFKFIGEMVFPAKPDDFDFAKKFLSLSTTLIAEGRIVVHPPSVGAKGLLGVFDGIQQLREKKVSGVKLVYRIADTPSV